MYDKVQDNAWRIDIEFNEDDTHTHATVRATRDDGETASPRATPTATPATPRSPWSARRSPRHGD